MAKGPEIPLPCRDRPHSCFSCPFRDCILAENINNNRLEAKYRKCGEMEINKRPHYYKTGYSVYTFE